MRKGFSLAEILVALSIVAIVSAIVFPILLNANSNIYPNLYKSAFRLTESVVADLIADPALYPSGNLYNPAETGYFCNNFFNKVNALSKNSCITSTVAGTPNLTTVNGMRWYGLNGSFGANTTITVDLDGSGRGQNTAGSVDVVQIVVTPLGRVTIPSDSGSPIERSYLQ